MVRVMSDSEAEGMARLVLIVMANRAGGDDDVCFASVERLAHEARLGTRTVQRAIAKLVEIGDLTYLGVHPEYRTNMHKVMPEGGVSESHPPADVGHVLTPNRKKQELGSELGSLAETPQVEEPSLAPRKRDALFEAVAEVCGIDWQNGVTKTSRGWLNKAVAELRPLHPDPDDVRFRAGNWPYDVPLTPTALAKHWPALSKEPKPRLMKSTVSALKRADRLEAEGR